MSDSWCRQQGNSLRLRVQAAPNAKRSEVMGPHGDALRIRLQAQAIEGKANHELIRFLSETLDIPKSAIQILQGQTGRSKNLELSHPGLTVEAVVQRLLPTYP